MYKRNSGNRNRGGRGKLSEAAGRRGIAALLILAALYLIGSYVVGPERMDRVLDVLYSETDMTYAPAQVEGELKIHFIDVGQGDATLIQAGEEAILIDAGETGSEKTVIPYLKSQGVQRLDLVIGTHMHSDHVGGMASVLEEFPVGELVFSKLPDDLTPTTRMYERLLDTVAEKGLTITDAQPGNQFIMEDGASLTILGPLGSDYDDLNLTSVVCRLDYGEISFLFTGDAEKKNENELLEEYPAQLLAADVLKLGHHGSNTSNTAKWLDAVGPAYAVALVGADNDYGHPHQEVTERLEDREIKLLRSDRDGTVVFGTDGEALLYQVENNQEPSL